MANKLKAPKAPIVTMAQTPATISQSIIKIEIGFEIMKFEKKSAVEVLT